MYRIFNKFALTILIIVNFTSINTCHALNIVSSIKPFYNITVFITQDVNVNHTLLVKQNASPHDFNLKPSDISNLNQADLIIWSGPGLETFLIKLLKKPDYQKQLLQLDKADNLKILPLRSNHTCSDNHHDHSHHNHYNSDPHFWLNPANAKVIAADIAKQLRKIDPVNQQQYKTNLANFNVKINNLVTDLNNQLGSIQHKPFMVFHDGYQYFEHYFKLNLVGFVTIDPNLPSSAKKILTLQKQIIKQKAVCIFSEPQFQPKIINTIISNTNIKTGELDPLGADNDLGTDGYFLLLEKLAESMLGCLND